MGLPGSMRFWMPSRPAINIAANARYPLHEGSGERNSTRFARGFGEYIGIRGAVALRIDQVDRRLVTRHQAAIRVRGRSAKPAERPGVFQQAADIKAAELAELGVLRAVEEVSFAFPNALMDMHARGVVFKQRFGHESRGHAVLAGHVLDHVFV